jgi:hypothetical protein
LRVFKTFCVSLSTLCDSTLPTYVECSLYCSFFFLMVVPCLLYTPLTYHNPLQLNYTTSHISKNLIHPFLISFFTSNCTYVTFPCYKTHNNLLFYK